MKEQRNRCVAFRRQAGARCLVASQHYTNRSLSGAKIDQEGWTPGTVFATQKSGWTRRRGEAAENEDVDIRKDEKRGRRDPRLGEEDLNSEENTRESIQFT